MTNHLTFLQKKNWLVFLSFLLAAAWIIAIYFVAGIYFETNDDRYMLEILSGALTGTCEPHIIFINYLLSYPLCLLYKITYSIPWYGIMLIAFHLLAYAIIIYSTLKLCTTWKVIAIRTAAVFCVFFVSTYITGLLQFTSTASFVAIAGYIYLFCTYIQKCSCSKYNYNLFLIIELLAFLIREDAMIMISALGFGALTGLFIYLHIEETPSREGNSFSQIVSYVFTKLIPLICCLLIVFAIGRLGNIIGYHGPDWEEYQRFNIARANMFDYQGAPSYENAKHILDKYNVSQKEYNAFCHYTILTEHISADCIEELEHYVHTSSETSSVSSLSQNITSALMCSFQTYASSNLWSIGKILLLLYFFCLLYFFMTQKCLLLFPLSGVFLSRTIAWSFLLYKGRIVNRVTFPLYLCEMLFLLTILFLCKGKTHNNHHSTLCIYGNSIIMIAIVFILLKSFAHTGIQEIRYVKEQNDTQKVYIEGLVEIQEYVNSRPSQTFLIEANSLSYYRGSAFDTRIYRPRNALVTGCWYSQSPPMKARIDTYLNSFDSPIYFMVAESSESRFTIILDYLEELYESAPIINETFTASHGGTHLVYYFE